MSRRPLLVLDPLRLACALFVMAHHYAAIMPLGVPQFLQTTASGLDLTASRADWAWPGWIGVEIFFVLSGYVIAGSLGNGAAGFMRRRLLRLLPAAWMCSSLTLVVALCFAGAHLSTFGAWARALVLIPSDPLIDASYWTIAPELAFYGATALAVDRGLALKRFAALLTSASALFWVVGIGFGLRIPTQALSSTLLPHGAFFALGILLSLGRDAPLGRLAWLLVPTVCADAAEIVHRAGELARTFHLPASPVQPMLVFAAAVALIRHGDHLHAALDRVGAARLRFLGLLTYPLYLIHQHVGEAIIVVLRRAGWSWSTGQFAAALVVIACATVVTRAERHVRAAAVHALDLCRPHRGRSPTTRTTAPN